MTNREQTLKWNKNSYNYYYCSELHIESVARVEKRYFKARHNCDLKTHICRVTWNEKRGREQQAWKRADVKRSCWLPCYHAHDVIMLADKMSVQTRAHNRLIFSDEYCKDEKLKTYTENTIWRWDTKKLRGENVKSLNISKGYFWVIYRVF